MGETYYRYEHPEEAGKSEDTLGNIGRLGSLSLVLFAVITLSSSIILPYLVAKPEDPSSDAESKTGRFTPRPPPSLGKEVQKVLMRTYETFRDHAPDLVTTWGISSVLFALIMVWAPFVRSLAFATTLVALCGVPWAVSCWAPFSEMGVEINKLAHHDPDMAFATGGYTSVTNHEDEVELETGQTASNGLLSEEKTPQSGELAGIYLGVLNVYTTLPQFIGTFLSFIVFFIFEPTRNAPATDSDPNDNGDSANKYLTMKGVNSIAVCLFVGAICSLVAAEATRRLKLMK